MLDGNGSRVGYLGTRPIRYDDKDGLPGLESESPGTHCTSFRNEVWVVNKSIRNEANDAAV
jgi:hypothetical protein